MTLPPSFLSEIQELEEAGLKRELLRPDQGGLINLSSNDYLGLSHHPDVLQAGKTALEKCAAGGTASRLLGGTNDEHVRLENDLAAFFQKDAALVFSSGYHTNTGILPAIADSGDMIFVDKLCHASILDGVKLSSARFATFDHNDVHHLETLLKNRRSKYRRAFIVTEGVFSMDGDIPPLRNMAVLSRRYDALFYLDEAHSLGLMGPDGRGLAAAQNVLPDVDILVGTLSKALGSQGGFAAAQKPIIDLLISKSRSFIYSTALSPVCAAAARMALSLFPSLADRRECLQKNAEEMRSKLSALKFDTLQSQSQIIPIMTGDVLSTKKLSDYLFQAGFFVPSIRPPTVPIGKGRVRVSITNDVIELGLTGLVQAFAAYSDKLGNTGEIIGQTD